MKRKEIKASARINLKRHFLFFVVICLALSLLGSAYSESTSVLRSKNPLAKTSSEGSAGSDILRTSGLSDVEYDIFLDQLHSGNKLAEQIEEKYLAESGEGILGRGRGMLAQFVNGVTSGSILVRIAQAFRSVLHSEKTIVDVLVLVSLFMSLFWWFYIKSVARVIAARMFLEGRIYKDIPVGRVLFLWDLRCWGNTAIVLLLTRIQLFLWSLTIAGGFVKRYSYYMVPYIMAENPSLNRSEAVALSRRLMDGHKAECFILELSFAGWLMLGIATAGLSEILYSNPYRSATLCEYYAQLRIMAVAGEMPGCELLNDRALFEKASPEQLSSAYPELELPSEEQIEFRGIRKFFMNFIGVVRDNSDMEQKWQKQKDAEAYAIRYRSEREGTAYPTLLSPLNSGSRGEARKYSGYFARHYTWQSIIMMFFIFSVAGWVWEVTLHLLTDGTFVNRGALTGPWLPIYGSGSAVMLIFLYCLRRRPLLEFLGIVTSCGAVEYFTSWFLEKEHNGLKWWDYSGYFLNINGRVCAEGLLLFGVGGMVIIYLLAPLLDIVITKISRKILLTASIILILLFTIDVVHSTFFPNTGQGITKTEQTNRSSVQSDDSAAAQPDAQIIFPRVREGEYADLSGLWTDQ